MIDQCGNVHFEAIANDVQKDTKNAPHKADMQSRLTLQNTRAEYVRVSYLRKTENLDTGPTWA